MFAGTQGDGIYRSSDHGNTWAKTDVNNLLLADALVLAFCVKDNNLFAGAINGIYKSTDGGATFQRTLNGFPPNIGVTAYSLAASGGDVVAAVNVSFSASDGSSLAYAGVFGQSSSVKGLYKSTDAGVTWTQRQALNVDIERLAANGNNVLAGDLFGAYYSLDFGESWAFSDPPGNCPFGCGIFTYTLRGSSVFAGDEVGMFHSTDGGASWVPINEGFPQCPIPDVEASCADSNYLFAGTFGDGVWRKLLGTGTPTPTPTASPSTTATPTPTTSPSSTATPTSTPTATPIPTATLTPPGTATPTPTATPRVTPTPRFVPTPRIRPTPAPRP